MPNFHSQSFSDKANPKKQYIPGFDSLRFFAASIVIVCQIELVKHYRGMQALISEIIIYEIGKLLVASFFVLSGFLITMLLLNEKARTGTIRPLLFYIRRGLRIWPLYYLIIILVFFVLPLFQSFYVPLQSEELQENFVVKFIFCLLLMPQMLLIKFRSIPGGEQLWTVGTEEIFYLLWPLLLRKSKNELRLAVSFITIFALIKYYLYNFSGINLWHSHPSLIYKAYLALYYNRIDCIVLGALAAILVQRKNKFWLNAISDTHYLLPVILLIGLLFLFGLNFMPVDYFFYSLCFAWLVSYIAVTPRTPSSHILSLAEQMGKCTYGIYLWHFIMLFIAFALLNYFFDEANRNSILANVFLYITTYLLTYTVAVLSYRFIEAPILKLKVRFASND